MPDITNPGMREPSAACEAFVKDFEKCRLTAYLPTPDDVWTIGWGSTGPGIRPGLVWTQERADARFASDLANFAGTVDKLIGEAPTTQGNFDAMVSLAYNIGLQAFRDSTLLRMHKATFVANAELQFARWNKQKGRALAGLTRRRAGEAAMYAGKA